MSIALMTEAWKLDLSPSDKMVLLALADAANDEGVTWIAVKHRKEGDSRLDLLTKCSLSERAVQGALKRLVEAGYLSRRDVPGKGVIWTVTPAASAPPQHLRPAANDANPRSICGETVSNRNTTSEAKASSVARPAKSRGSRTCPVDWVPAPSLLDYGESKGLTLGEVAECLEAFRDYEFARTYTDWDSTFRGWLRREAKKKSEREARYVKSSRPSKSDHLAGIFGAMGVADRYRADDGSDPPEPRHGGGMRALPPAA